ncbi:GMC oxidoreductase [Hebeloma cylindrosporum]|uniref:pyranose dehydrogenase (acceptor) n=1 Tax=Hebeloma cylindrosporum TaxID=76867 RepID=A0A0C2Y3A4_HEBCY|nr:GMC oxidoreductase [Hebeloma cylindrosporum h7]
MTIHSKLHGIVFCFVAAVRAAAQDFDYVIVGGGASGALVAAKLSANPSVRVAILEAGFLVENNAAIVPALFGSFIGNPDLDWGFTSTPQDHLNGRQLGLPRGKALGGTAAVNGMYFVRGSTAEYDAWEKLGNPGWNWNTINEHIKSIESFTPAPPEIAQEFGSEDAGHGTQGPINVTFSNYYAPNSVIPAFRKTMQSLGVAGNKAASAGSNLGVYEVPTAVDHTNRTRSYVVNGFLEPNKNRQNLVINTGALVTNINFASGSPLLATGVQYIQNNVTKILKVKPSGKVILAAGTYQTPKILQLSGIGNATLLKSLNIEARNNLPGVGQNLQDHVGVLGVWEINPAVGQSYDAILTNATFATEQWASYLANRTGVYASVPGSTVVFMPYSAFIPPARLTQLKADLDQELKAFKGTPYETQLALQRQILDDESVPQVELVMTTQVQSALVTPELGKSYLSIAANVVRPFSRGSVYPSSTDPTARPAINLNYLGIHHGKPLQLAFLVPLIQNRMSDFQILKEAFSFVLNNVTKTAPFSDILTVLREPSNTTDAGISQYIIDNIFSVWHPCGSSSMLPISQNGVVDSKLKVYGTKNVHVVDAGLIPLELSTHTMATVYGNAAFAAELISI